jgi:putative transposase
VTKFTGIHQRSLALRSILHRAERERVGRHPDPSAAILDSQSVKAVEESAHICGYDAHKRVKGRKRHLLVDTLGLPIISYVMPADVHDTVGARKVLVGLTYFAPRLKQIWTDAAYRGQELADRCQQQGGWDLEIVERDPGSRGFNVQPRRWVVERSFAWLCRNRRPAKDHERKVQTSETLLIRATVRLLLRRLAHSSADH